MAIILVLIVSLLTNIYLIFQQTNLLNKVDKLTNENGILQNEKQSLVNQTDNLTHENQILQNDKTSLEEQLSQIEPNNSAAKLSNSKGWLVTSLGITDVTDFPLVQGAPRIFIQGTVSNIGNDTAHDCVLYVKLYQNGSLGYEVYKHLGSIESGSHVNIYENVIYNGGSVSNWEVFPLFDESYSTFNFLG